MEKLTGKLSYRTHQAQQSLCGSAFAIQVYGSHTIEQSSESSLLQLVHLWIPLLSSVKRGCNKKRIVTSRWAFIAIAIAVTLLCKKLWHSRLEEEPIV